LGDPYLLMGAFMIAFAPLAHVAVGYRQKVHKPMTDEQVKEVIPNMRRGFRLLWIGGGVVCIFVFLRISATYAHRRGYWGLLESIHIGKEPTDWAARRENILIRDILNYVSTNFTYVAMLILQLMFNFIGSFQLTCMTGVDFIIIQMIESRRCERALTTRNWATMDHEVYSISEQYTRRMDQLITLEAELDRVCTEANDVSNFT